jgi:hypothetical protein
MDSLFVRLRLRLRLQRSMWQMWHRLLPTLFGSQTPMLWNGTMWLLWQGFIYGRDNRAWLWREKKRVSDVRLKTLMQRSLNVATRDAIFMTGAIIAKLTKPTIENNLILIKTSSWCRKWWAGHRATCSRNAWANLQMIQEQRGESASAVNVNHVSDHQRILEESVVVAQMNQFNALRGTRASDVATKVLIV